MHTRQMRVGWLGIGVILFVSTAAWAGPSFVRFDEPDPATSTTIPGSSSSLVARTLSNSDDPESVSIQSIDDFPAIWHALPEPQIVSMPKEAGGKAAVAVDVNAQPLSVPLQFGWLGVLAFTTVGSYFGARWIGIRRNHSR